MTVFKACFKLHKTGGYFLIQLQIYSHSIQLFFNPYNTPIVLTNNSIFSLSFSLKIKMEKKNLLFPIRDNPSFAKPKQGSLHLSVQGKTLLIASASVCAMTTYL